MVSSSACSVVDAAEVVVLSNVVGRAVVEGDGDVALKNNAKSQTGEGAKWNCARMKLMKVLSSNFGLF